MKKKLFILIMLLLGIFSIRVNAEDEYEYTFIWKNTEVYVPVNDAIANYLKLPSATLCRNGLPTNEYVGMLYGEDDTDQDLIDTRVLGTYYLTYRAVSTIEETARVSFIVVDNSGPYIEEMVPLKCTVSSSINYDLYFSISDNYYSNDDLKIVYDDSEVNYNTVGEYNFYVVASDPSGNVNRYETTISITPLTDDPKYEPCAKSYEISYGDLFVPSNYFTAYDASGKNISSNIEAELDTTSLGNHKVLFSVSDEYGNKSVWNQDILVYDDILPTITLLRDRIEISVGEIGSLDATYFLKNIEKKEDNSAIKSVDVEYSSIKKSIGEYEVTYTVTDIAGNVATKVLAVSVVCNSVPTIEVSDIYIDVGDSINYYIYFKIYDTYDGDITIQADIDDSNVDVSKEGVYFAYISVKNSYGKTNYATITVHVQKSFISKYYWLFLIPLGVGAVVAFIFIKKRKSVI